jgi:hypothetical protein
MAIFFCHHGSEGWGIFTIGKCGAKFKILKCSKQTRALSPFPQLSTLVVMNKSLIALGNTLLMLDSTGLCIITRLGSN